MKEKMKIFEVELDMLTAKAAMKKVIEYMAGQSVSTVVAVTREMLLHGQDDPEWKKQMNEMDMVLAQEPEIFEAVQDIEKSFIRDLDGKVFWRMFLRYLQRGRKKIFLLAENAEELEQLKQAAQPYEKGMRIAGAALLPEDGSLKDNVINEINGVEPDCIFSALPSPQQERFISENKACLNARLWMGCRPMLQSVLPEKKGQAKLKRFFLKKVFHYQLGKQKSDEEGL